MADDYQQALRDYAAKAKVRGRRMPAKEVVNELLAERRVIKSSLREWAQRVDAATYDAEHGKLVSHQLSAIAREMRKEAGE